MNFDLTEEQALWRKTVHEFVVGGADQPHWRLLRITGWGHFQLCCSGANPSNQNG